MYQIFNGTPEAEHKAPGGVASGKRSPKTTPSLMSSARDSSHGRVMRRRSIAVAKGQGDHLFLVPPQGE